jgi:hypothetical protein
MQRSATVIFSASSGRRELKRTSRVRPRKNANDPKASRDRPYFAACPSVMTMPTSIRTGMRSKKPTRPFTQKGTSFCGSRNTK